MDNDPVTTCLGLFYDSGGASDNIGATWVCIVQGSYSNNESYTKTFCSSTSENMMFTFDELDIVGSDWLKVYDGNSTAAPLLMTLNSSSTSPTIISSGTCLTFEFHSGDNGTTGWLSGDCDDGGNWSASIQCITVYPINPSGTVNTCNGIFTDDGGMSANYGNNANYTKTFCPEGGSCVKINFSSLELGPGDELKFFDGSSAVGVPLMTLTQGSSIPSMGVGSNTGNCLTVQFITDGSGNAPGWVATVFCPPSCGTPPQCVSNPPANNQCINATPICNLNGFCGNTSSSYNSLDHNGTDWDNLSGLNFCGSVENNSWLSFVADGPTAELNVWTMNCANSDGIQMEIYATTDCQTFTSHSNCVSVGTPTDFTIQAYNLTPVNTYYLMIDGFAGDNCDYIISAASGINVGAQITPEQTICLGNSANIIIDGVGAGASYSWGSNPNDPSMIINGSTINVTPLETTTYYVTVSGASANPNCPPINEVFQTQVIVVSDTSSMCQPQYTCEMAAAADDDTICSGDPVNLTSDGAIGLTLLANDFDDGTAGTGWGATTTATFTNPCGPPPPGGAIYLWMGAQSPAPRRLESNDFSILYGGEMYFYLRYAEQGDASPCEGPDEIDEGITLQYSINSGISWTPIAYFNPSGVVEPNGNIYQGQGASVATGATAFTVWAQYMFPVPVAAQTASTRFRWIQEVSTDNVYDHWGLDSIFVRANAPNVETIWTANPPMAGFPYTGVNPPTTYPTVSTWFTATITNGTFSCSDSVFVEVQNIDVDFTVNDSTQCMNGNSFVFSASTTGATYIYGWSFGDGGTSILDAPLHVYTQPGTFQVVLVESMNGCIDTVSHYVYVYPEPTFSFSSVPSCANICNGSVVSTPVGVAPFTFSWDNNEITQSLSNVCSGNYTLTLTDANGCSYDSTAIVTQHPSPGIDFDSVPTCDNVCNGSITAYGMNTVPPYSYEWDNGTQFQTVSNACAGINTVTVTDALGCSSSASNSVTYYPAININLATTRVKCYGENTGTATAIPSGGGGNTWYFQWSLNANAQTSSTAIGLYAGEYFVTVSDNLGCKEDTSVVVTQPDLLVITACPDTHLCYHTQGTLYVTPAGGTPPYYYFWNTNPGGQTLTINPEYSSSYLVYAIDSNNCISNTEMINVNVDPKLQITLMAQDDTICPGSAASISAYVSGGDGGPYTIYNPTGNIIDLPFTPFPAYNPTNYHLYAHDHCGASAVDTISIYQYPVPVVLFTSDKFFGCQPLTIQFNEGTNNSGSLYEWNFNDYVNNFSHSRNPVHTFESAGVYDISLSVSDDNGCRNTYTVPAMITVYPNPEARYNSMPELVSIANPKVEFNNYSSGHVQSMWDFDDGDSSLFEHPVHVFSSTGVFDVSLVVTSEYGCTDTTTHSINVRDEYTFYAPTVFSPDADGINDIFKVYGYGINPSKFNLYIYDRWGQVLFETNDLNKGWDGRLKRNSTSGKDIVKTGTYTWFVIYTDITGVVHHKTGPVTVVH